MSLVEKPHARVDKSREEDNTTVRRGSGDFLRDQGVDADEFRLEAHLCHDISAVIEARALSQEAVAEITGLAQSDVSRIVTAV